MSTVKTKYTNNLGDMSEILMDYGTPEDINPPTPYDPGTNGGYDDPDDRGKKDVWPRKFAFLFDVPHITAADYGKSVIVADTDELRAGGYSLTYGWPGQLGVPRDITLTGDVTEITKSFDGSSDITFDLEVTHADQADVATNADHADTISTPSDDVLYGFRNSQIDVPHTNDVMYQSAIGGTLDQTTTKRLDSLVAPTLFGAVGDGVADDRVSITNWLTHLLTNGGIGYVPAGTYRLTSGVTVPLNASAKIIVSPAANFVAADGFTAANRMIMITTGTDANGDYVFDWEGGCFDATKQPNSQPGESCDIFSFNATNCQFARIILDKTYSGADWSTSGSDSHLFCAGPIFAELEIRSCTGAVDSGIYASSDITGTRGQGLTVRGNFYNCASGATVKRLYENIIMDIKATQCKSGAAISTADVSGTIEPGGNNCNIRAIGWKCDQTCSLYGVTNGIVNVSAMSLGIDNVGGYTSTSPIALRLAGARSIIANVVVNGVNSADQPVIDASYGAKLEAYMIGSINYGAVDNIVTLNANTIGTALYEGANCDRNTLINKCHTATTASTRSGAGTVLDEHVAGQTHSIDYGADGLDIQVSNTRTFLIPRSSVTNTGAATAGGLKFITNGRKNGEAAGAGTGVLAYSDGTNWFRVSDDTVVAQ